MTSPCSPFYINSTVAEPPSILHPVFSSTYGQTFELTLMYLYATGWQLAAMDFLWFYIIITYIRSFPLFPDKNVPHKINTSRHITAIHQTLTCESSLFRHSHFPTKRAEVFKIITRLVLINWDSILWETKNLNFDIKLGSRSLSLQYSVLRTIPDYLQAIFLSYDISV